MTTLTEKAREQAEARRFLPPPKLRKWLRVQAGLTQQQIADEVGVSRVAVSHWEDGRRTPRGDDLVKYAEVLRELEDVLMEVAAS